MNYLKDENSGFTLIELLLSIALLAISIGVTNDILISLIRSNNKTQVTNEIEQQANFVSLKMEKELRSARSATATTGSATLQLISADGTTVFYEVNTSTGVLCRRVTAGGTCVPLTSSRSPGGVRVSCVGGGNSCFIVSSGTPTTVDVRLLFVQAQALAQGASYAGRFEINTTIVLRNTY